MEQNTQQEQEQKNKRNKLDSQWFLRIMKEEAKLGIIQTTLQRFSDYYLLGRGNPNAKSAF